MLTRRRLFALLLTLPTLLAGCTALPVRPLRRRRRRVEGQALRWRKNNRRQTY